jgi:hypothetical protein
VASLAEFFGQRIETKHPRTNTMATSTDYVPSKLADFAVWLANFSALLTAAPATYGLAAPDAADVAAKSLAFSNAYAVSSVPVTRTAGAIAQTNAQRAITTAGIRPYAVRIAANTSVTPEDKVAIGVTVRSLTPTPIPPPTDVPALALESAISLNHTLRSFNTATPTSKSKPFGSIAIQVFRAIGTVAAIDPDQAVYYASVTKSPFVVNFGAQDQGKKCTYFARYQTTSGAAGIAATGPWSEPLTIGVI